MIGWEWGLLTKYANNSTNTRYLFGSLIIAIFVEKHVRIKQQIVAAFGLFYYKIEFNWKELNFVRSFICLFVLP